jgi:hypothetical protein
MGDVNQQPSGRNLSSTSSSEDSRITHDNFKRPTYLETSDYDDITIYQDPQTGEKYMIGVRINKEGMRYKYIIPTFTTQMRLKKD